MGDRVELDVEVKGLRIQFAGGAGLFEELVRDLVSPLAKGAWRPSLFVLAPEEAEAIPARPATAPSPAAAPSTAFPSTASPFEPRLPVPAPVAVRAAGSPAAFDPAPLYRALAAEEGRRADRDAVLLALVALAASGKRDATPAEITAHLVAGGFPAEDLKPRPILAKLGHRKGLVAPGLLPGTFRATPTGVAAILRRARGG